MLKDIIVEELKKVSPRPPEKILNQLADNIILKLPKEEVVAEGEVGSGFFYSDIDVGNNCLIRIYDTNGENPFRKLIGKNIRLKVEVIK